ncbi:MAG: hypothetical protein Q7J34_02720 [Bacteroidales bacterium]|nr:hypothetical protein [Bacteroidales bacterium]
MADKKVQELLSSFRKHSFEGVQVRKNGNQPKVGNRNENEILSGAALDQPGIKRIKEYLMYHD